jgi:protoporphyrinogen oxidase
VTAKSVGIVGGGILGLSAAYRLARAGVHVSVYERSSDLGGLVGSFDFDGRPADRFYHVILPTDDRVIGLATELGLGDRFRFRPTGVGFYGAGRLFSMTSPAEFLTFPILRPWDRARLAAFVARCQMIKDYDELDDVPLLEWLNRLSGRRVVDRLWAPLLDSKFDGRYRSFDHVVCTLAPVVAQRIMAPQLALALPPDPFRYLGVVCLLLRLRGSVSPYYHLNITDRSIPLTTVVETTHVVDPDYAGGTLLYVSKYVDPSHGDLGRPEGEVEREYLAHAKAMLPRLRDEDILARVVQRARVVEPVHLVGGAKRLPPMFPVDGLALASTAHVYPEIVSGQAVTGVAEQVVAGVLERLDMKQEVAA